eukprot:TRINITY_DN237_c0_g1_i1.p1 TRINITY_DN237_c0_g1~~TRINITY_DN237_c0_g1_i1.p1  ORF type:complete len:823 (+),score=110.20 TRINITY_DN237_c0_g1_i1:1003-3471(+)
MDAIMSSKVPPIDEAKVPTAEVVLPQHSNTFDTLPEQHVLVAEPVPTAAPIGSTNGPFCSSGTNNDELPPNPARPSGRKSSEFLNVGCILRKGFEDIRERYALGRELGRGQFGVIRLCIDKRTSEPLAVKAISKSRLRTVQDIEDVLREVKAMEVLAGHPAIIHLRATAEDSRRVYLIMDLCEGGELFERITERKRYPERDAAQVFATLVSVVAHCQSKGIVHRDLKPENILLCNKESHCLIKVVDFGLAAFLKPGQRLTPMAGSAYYIAPEVLLGSYGMEADMWSIGVVLYIMLCGLPPFWHEKEEGIFAAIRSGKYDLKGGPWKRISEGAKDLVTKSLIANPALRIKPDAALAHPWILEHCPSFRPIRTAVSAPTVLNGCSSPEAIVQHPVERQTQTLGVEPAVQHPAERQSPIRGGVSSPTGSLEPLRPPVNQAANAAARATSCFPMLGERGANVVVSGGDPSGSLIRSVTSESMDSDASEFSPHGSRKWATGEYSSSTNSSMNSSHNSPNANRVLSRGPFTPGDFPRRGGMLIRGGSGDLFSSQITGAPQLLPPLRRGGSGGELLSQQLNQTHISGGGAGHPSGGASPSWSIRESTLSSPVGSPRASSRISVSRNLSQELNQSAVYLSAAAAAQLAGDDSVGGPRVELGEDNTWQTLDVAADKSDQEVLKSVATKLLEMQQQTKEGGSAGSNGTRVSTTGEAVPAADFTYSVVQGTKSAQLFVLDAKAGRYLVRRDLDEKRVAVKAFLQEATNSNGSGGGNGGGSSGAAPLLPPLSGSGGSSGGGTSGGTSAPESRIPPRSPASFQVIPRHGPHAASH